MKSHPVKVSSAIMLLVCSTVIGCGVKAAPTPALPSPPGSLQQEAQKRALERKEKEKEKAREKEKAPPPEKASP